MESKKFNERIRKQTDLLEDIRMDIDTQIDKCKVYTQSMKKFDNELAEIKKLISSIPAEIIDIDKVVKQIHMKKRQKDKLLADNLGLRGQIMECEEFNKNFTTTFSEERLTELISFNQQISDLSDIKKEHESQIRHQKTHVKNLKKRIKLLEEVPCGDKFSKCKFICDAVAAKKKLPVAEREWQELGVSIQKIVDNIEKFDIETIQEELGALKELKDKNTHNTRLIEKNKLVMSQHKAKIDLLKNEIGSLEKKSKRI